MLFDKIVNREEKKFSCWLRLCWYADCGCFAKKADVIGYDLNEAKIELYKSGIDPTNEVGNEAIKAQL